MLVLIKFSIFLKSTNTRKFKKTYSANNINNIRNIVTFGHINKWNKINNSIINSTLPTYSKSTKFISTFYIMIITFNIKLYHNIGPTI